MKTISVVLVSVLFYSTLVSGQENPVKKPTDDKKKVAFKVENIALQGSLVVSQVKRVYNGEVPSQIGGSYFEGFVRQPIGFGYDLSVTYYVVRKKGILVDVGLGFWSYAVNYKAIEDSVVLFSPGSSIRQYSDHNHIFYLPFSVAYSIKDRLEIGIKASLPMVVGSRLTSMDSTLMFKNHWKSPELDKLMVEGRIGYGIKAKIVRLTPSISFGGIPMSVIRHAFLYKAGLIIQYLRHEK